MLKSVAQVMAAYVDSELAGAPGVLNALSHLGDVPDGRPFSQAEYDANAAAGAEYDARQAVRKALGRMKADRPAEALTVLDAAAARLPDGPHRAAVAALAAKLRAEVGAG
jgi:predicted secreted protein